MAKSGSGSGSEFLNSFKILKYVLESNTKSDGENVYDVPECPVLVFINSKSGGQLGGNLLVTYRQLLNDYQVFDVGVEAPDKVLRRIYGNLVTHRHNGDEYATKIQEKLRIIVAGGDGTAGWLLGVVCDLKLAHPPPIATVPLGTGNNLPFAFGWGKKNPGTDPHAVESFLRKVKEAKEMKIDSWHLLMRMKIPKGGPLDPIAPLELPHSLHAFGRVSETNDLNMEGFHTFRGGFWNYFSMGMDAEVSYAFHSERKLHPEKFKHQLVNQSTYAKLGFSPTLSQNSARKIPQFAKVMIMKNRGDKWEELFLPPSIKSIVCLNLPSFSGGFNPWGTPSKWKHNELERMADPKDLDCTNSDGRTPREEFTWNHRTLAEAGEKSMKETATSSSALVAALIITIMFSAAVTVPGGIKGDNGSPIYLHTKAFWTFIVADVISLCSSTTSVMVFVGILTSRFAEQDFLTSLPTKLIIGFLTLFLSIAAMMTAFSSAIFIMLPGKRSIAISSFVLACFPTASFLWMQFPYLLDIIISTYGSSFHPIYQRLEGWVQDIHRLISRRIRRLLNSVGTWCQSNPRANSQTDVAFRHQPV